MELNLSVDEDAQNIFDQINFVFPSKWEGDVIIINDMYKIAPPYKSVKPKGKEDVNASYLTRLEKAVRIKFDSCVTFFRIRCRCCRVHLRTSKTLILLFLPHSLQLEAARVKLKAGR